MSKFIPNILMLFASLTVFGGIYVMSCWTKVPAGNVGVKVYLLGSSKGVDSEELPVGRYWVGWNEELYLYPTFTQNVDWKSQDSLGDQSIYFQTSEANKILAESLTPALVNYKSIEKWNGTLPYMTGSNVVPFIQMTLPTPESKVNENKF